MGSQQPVISNGGGVVAAGIGTANGLNTTSTSGSVQNLVDSCVVSTYEKFFLNLHILSIGWGIYKFEISSILNYKLFCF
jgi:hypothetical protein